MIKLEDPILKRVRDVIEHGAQAIGKQHFIDLCYGDVLAASNMIRAYCYDCMGWYEDGIGDCGNIRCPLYFKMPYASTLLTMPALSREKNRNVARNPSYPIEKRLTSGCSVASKKKDLNKVHTERAIAQKLKPRKYPQEITQKQVQP